jgi:hypothetical protein
VRVCDEFRIRNHALIRLQLRSEYFASVIKIRTARLHKN